MTLAVIEELNVQPGKLSRRERENLRQRAEILEAALRLFSQKGYHNVSMREIAGEAEFGIGTLYKFFSNKESLYKALMMEMARFCHTTVMEALSEEQSPLSAINKYIEVRRELFVNNISLMRLYFAETTGASFNIKAGLDKDLAGLYDELIKELVLVFQRGIRENIFRDIDPHNMALALEGSLNAILWRLIEDPAKLQDSSDLSIIADIFFRGVLIQ